MRWLVALTAAACGCKAPATFSCTDSSQCRLGGMVGTCEPTGYCSFLDPSCPSGIRYDDTASGDLSGACVAPPIDAAVDAPSDARDPLAIRINIGGPMFTGTDYPGVWAADPTGATCNGTTFKVTNAIDNTVDDPLFQSDSFGNPFGCKVRNLPANSYRVTLLFANIFYGCAGNAPNEMKFIVSAEGVVVTPEINVYQESGGCAAGGGGRPFTHTFDAVVTDGTLDLSFDITNLYGVLNAIELVAQY